MGWIGDEPPALTVNEQVELLENRLTDQDLVAEDERLIERVSAFESYEDRLGHGDDRRTTVGIFRPPLPARLKAETSDDVLRQDRPDRAGVDKRVGFERSHF